MPAKPTAAQLNYLRTLASRTGQTFAYPATREQASAEIARLKAALRSSRLEVRIERKLIADQVATGPEDAARVREFDQNPRADLIAGIPPPTVAPIRAPSPAVSASPPK